MSFVGAGATIGNLGQRAAHHRTRMFSSPGPRPGGPPCLRKKTRAPVIASGDIGVRKEYWLARHAHPAATRCNRSPHHPGAARAARHRCWPGAAPEWRPRKPAKRSPISSAPRSRHPRHACGAQRAGTNARGMPRCPHAGALRIPARSRRSAATSRHRARGGPGGLPCRRRYPTRSRPGSRAARICRGRRSATRSRTCVRVLARHVIHQGSPRAGSPLARPTRKQIRCRYSRAPALAAANQGKKKTAPVAGGGLEAPSRSGTD